VDKLLTKILNFIQTQWQGILIGLIITLTITFFKKIWEILRNLPHWWYKRKFQKDILKRINIANEEIGFPLLPKVELKIVNVSKPIEELEDKILIYVKKEKRPRVIAEIVALSIEHCFLQDVKRHINEKVFSSVKFTIGKSLLTQDKPPDNLKDIEKEALRYYERRMSEVLNDTDIAELIKKEEMMLRRRLFKTILIQELYALGERSIGKFLSSECRDESLKLIDFLFDIARKEEYEKETGQEPPLDFIGKYFKLGIVLVKKPEKRSLVSHLRAVKKKIENGMLSIYVLGLGKNVKEIEKDFVNWLKDMKKQEYNNWFVDKVIKFDLKYEIQRNIPGICVIYRNEKWI